MEGFVGRWRGLWGLTNHTSWIGGTFSGLDSLRMAMALSLCPYPLQSQEENLHLLLDPVAQRYITWPAHITHKHAHPCTQ